MAITRGNLKDWVKTARGLDRAANDGLLTNDFIDEAINTMLRKVADDCNLLPTLMKFALRSGQWAYPMPDDVLRIRRVWFVDSDGSRLPLGYLESEALLDYRDPATDTGTDPLFFSYPVYQARAYGMYANAPPVYDYIFASHVTTARIFTVEDSGINLGLTLDGRRIEPGCVVHNVTDDSFGYVDVLDMITVKIAGTADPGTDSDTLVDSAADFVTAGVAVGDIICTPMTGTVTSYGFVTAVAETTLTYTDMFGDARSFASGDFFKVGIANKIRLDTATPHPQLREGAQNYFAVGDAKATITGTTFTNTTVTGADTDGAEVDDIAVASGGSHAKVTGVDDNELTVDWWVGGQPADTETVTVRECDEYRVEGKMRDQRVMWIRPTPSASDTVGSESVEIQYNAQPKLPTRDTDRIEIPEKYEIVMRKCLMWQAADLTGKYDPSEMEVFEQYYNIEASKYKGDIWQPPLAGPMSVWNNRYPVRVHGVKDQSLSAMKWNLDF